jgi:hypothetical protein
VTPPKLKINAKIVGFHPAPPRRNGQLTANGATTTTLPTPCRTRTRTLRRVGVHMPHARPWNVRSVSADSAGCGKAMRPHAFVTATARRAEPLHLGDQRVQEDVVTCGEHKACAAAVELQRVLPTGPGRRPGDDRHVVADAHHCRRLPTWG